MPHNTKNAERRHTAIPRVLTFTAVVMGIASLSRPMHALEPKHGVLVGTILTIDAGAKTVAVKTADGAEHTLLFVEHTTVHGAKDVVRGAEDALRGLEKRTQVVVHYTAEGAKKTADEWTKSETMA